MTVLGVFKIALRLRDRYIFMWQSADILNVFSTLNLKQIFWKTKTFFKKLKYSSFPYKITISESNVKQILWGVQNGPFTKNGVLPVTSSFFWRFCFNLRTSYKELIWCTNDPNAYTRTFCKHWNLIWWCFIPVSILKLNES